MDAADSEKQAKEIAEIAAILLQGRPPGTTMADVEAEAKDIFRIQYVLGIDGSR